MDLPLLAELQRRRVFRALVGYGIAAFAVLQIVEPVMHGLRWPDEVLSYVVVALAVGFPVVVSLAWIFDVNAGRIERTAPATSGGPKGARLGLLLVGVGALAATPGVAWYFLVRGHARPVRAAAVQAAVATVSIAVLPLVNLSGDPGQEYFSDGMTEEITSKLSRLRGLAVTARTSAAKYKRTTRTAREIGAELAVAYLVEGSVRRAGDRIRVTASLVRTGDGVQAWSDDLDARLDDIFAVQQRVAGRIVEALGLKLSPGEASVLANWGTRNAAAYDEFLQGETRHGEDPDDPVAVKDAISHFEKALAIDTNFAPALASLAIADTSTYRNFDSSPSWLARAEALADRAMAIDPQLPTALNASANLRAVHFDYLGAAEQYRRVVALMPRDHVAWDRLCWTLGYAVPPLLAEAESACMRARELQQDFPGPLYHLLRVHVLENRLAQAEVDLVALGEHNGGGLVGSGRFWIALASKRPKDALDAIGGQKTNLNAAWRAMAYAQLGDLDRGFASLEKALASGYRDVPDLRQTSWYEPLRRDPRWAKTLRGHGIEP